jgi:UDP-N-acetylmuramoylalanine--D-glutamate ligase
MSGFPPDVFACQSFAVVGLGRNGLPAARALQAMGAKVVAWDDSAPARDAAAAAGLNLAEPKFPGLDALVLSPGIPHHRPAPHPLAAAALAAGVPILSDAELLYRAVRACGSAARFVGITGTNGKSTTTALLAHILAAAGIPVAAGGNLGTAALSLPLLPQDGVYVLEMSSYMLERLGTLRFDLAAMLNLSPDHLDRHGNMDGYVTAKREIFARQTHDDWAVVGTDDPASRAMADWLEGEGPHLVRISGHDALPKLPASLPGFHNAQNASAALALARAIGVPEAAMVRGLASFPGLPHRMERVATVAGVDFVNDSKATNAVSAATALDCFDRVVWIAGGIAKQGGIESLQKWSTIAQAQLIGRDASALAETLGRHGVPFDIAGTLDQAVPAAFARARSDSIRVVLLSPACASFDQFANFEARGERFRSLVAELARA